MEIEIGRAYSESTSVNENHHCQRLSHGAVILERSPNVEMETIFGNFGRGDAAQSSNEFVESLMLIESVFDGFDEEA